MECAPGCFVWLRGSAAASAALLREARFRALWPPALSLPFFLPRAAHRRPASRPRPRPSSTPPLRSFSNHMQVIWCVATPILAREPAARVLRARRRANALAKECGGCVVLAALAASALHRAATVAAAMAAAAAAAAAAGSCGRVTCGRCHCALVAAAIRPTPHTLFFAARAQVQLDRHPRLLGVLCHLRDCGRGAVHQPRLLLHRHLDDAAPDRLHGRRHARRPKRAYAAAAARRAQPASRAGRVCACV